MGRAEVRGLFLALLTGADASGAAEGWQDSDSRELAALSTAVFSQVVGGQFESAADPGIPAFVHLVLNDRGVESDVSSETAEAVIRSVLGDYAALERVSPEEVVPVQILLTSVALADRGMTGDEIDALLSAAEPTAWAAITPSDGDRKGEAAG